jgi:hypothetical protein
MVDITGCTVSGTPRRVLRDSKSSRKVRLKSISRGWPLWLGKKASVNIELKARIPGVEPQGFKFTDVKYCKQPYELDETESKEHTTSIACVRIKVIAHYLSLLTSPLPNNILLGSVNQP